MTPMWKMVTIAGAGVLATAGAGALALSAMGYEGLGRMGRADANGDGKVTRAEWIAAANTRFAALDTNRDGTLVAAELPRRGPRHGRGGHRGHHGGGGERGFAPPPAAPAPGAQPVPAPPALGNAQ